MLGTDATSCYLRSVWSDRRSIGLPQERLESSSPAVNFEYDIQPLYCGECHILVPASLTSLYSQQPPCHLFTFYLCATLDDDVSVLKLSNLVNQIRYHPSAL